MKPNSSQHDHHAEQDAVWDLLNQASSAEPSPSFVQNTVRAARLSAPTPSRWQQLLTHPALIAPSCAALVFGAILFWPASDAPSLADHSEPSSLVQTPVEAPQSTPTPEITPTPSADTEQTWLDTQLLATACTQPELFSDSELVALIF